MPGGPIISAHAIERYQQRVRPCSDDEAREAMSTPFIRAAVAFGAHLIRLGSGHRLIIRNGAIITITPAQKHTRGWLDRATRGELK